MRTTRDCTAEYWSEREAAAEASANDMKNPLAKRAMERLAEMEMISVILEGGSQINASALGAQIVDKMFLFYAPVIYGDAASPVVRSLEANTYFTTRLGSYRLYELGEDFGVEGYIHNPWEAA